MKKINLTVTIMAVLLTYALAFAGMDMGGMDHSKMGNGEKTEEKSDELMTAEQDGYSFKFKFIDMRDNMSGMDMGDMTHHLMVYITDASGKKITNAKVKYKIFAPSKKESEAMTMKMGGGYGADISLKEKGKHGIATLVMTGEKKVLVKIHHETK